MKKPRWQTGGWEWSYGDSHNRQKSGDFAESSNEVAAGVARDFPEPTIIVHDGIIKRNGGEYDAVLETNTNTLIVNGKAPANFIAKAAFNAGRLQGQADMDGGAE